LPIRANGPTSRFAVPERRLVSGPGPADLIGARWGLARTGTPGGENDADASGRSLSKHNHVGEPGHLVDSIRYEPIVAITVTREQGLQRMLDEMEVCFDVSARSMLLPRPVAHATARAWWGSWPRSQCGGPSPPPRVPLPHRS